MFEANKIDNSVGEVLRNPNGNVTMSELAPASDYIGPIENDHFVQFYETDTFLLDSLCGFIAAGLNSGDACIVVATKAHREGLEERLERHGIDVAAAKTAGLYLPRDAAETLSTLVVDGLPDAERFFEAIGGLVTGAVEGRKHVRVFGEMVALLWAERKTEAALGLEALWNDLHRVLPFTLFCAYPVSGFGDEMLAHELSDVCVAHSHIIPAESYSGLTTVNDRLRAIALLQQKAKALQTKIAEASEIEKRLAVSEVRYRRLFESSTDGVLLLDPITHKVSDVNSSLAMLFATTQEDLMGKELWEIGLLENQAAERDFWQDLDKNRILRYEHLEFDTKDGQHRDVEFVSNINEADGYQFIQCNLRDISERRNAEETSLHLAAIVESSYDAIISKSLEGIIVSWNKGAERTFGYSAEEVIGKSITILIPADRIKEEPRILERLKRGDRIEHYETVRLTKGGRPIDVSISVSPIRDSKGKIIAASKIARDITPQKQAEKWLREQAEIIETINRTGQELSAELNLESVAQVVIDASTELSGAEFGAFIYNAVDESGESSILVTLPKGAKEFFAASPLPESLDLFSPNFKREGTIRSANVSKDTRYDKTSPFFGIPADQLRLTSYLAVPVISRSREVLGGLFFGHSDEGVFLERHQRIVEGLAAQAAIAMDNARLYELSERERTLAETANRTKDEFLATVSHELRTPLNAIMGWAHMLRGGKLDEGTVVRALETIERNAKSQAQLIEDILDVSRVITGKLHLDIGPVDLASVINTAIDSVQLAADSKDIQLEVKLNPSARQVFGDFARLQQVIWNILSNAIKFTPPGGRIEVQLERAGLNAEIRISDSGDGISTDFLPFVFDRFRQADGTTTRTHGGLGLGLAIVRHLIELHGGTIHAESAGKGQGTTFTICLAHMSPKEHAARGLNTGSMQPEEDTKAPAVPIPSIDGVSVLLVDDDQDSLDMLTAILTGCKALVQTAASSQEALELLQWFKPDVLACDLAMPDDDGVSFIGKVRALDAENGKQTPALALTASVRINDRTRALSAGFNMFVPKPIEPSELITAIAGLVESDDANFYSSL